MAFSRARTNAELVDRMVAKGLITSGRVAEALKGVDRKHYVPSAWNAYEDSPQRIGFNATISAPHMHAHACENLLAQLDDANNKEGAILDVGSGSGYPPRAWVVGIDHVQGLTDMSLTNLANDGVAIGPAVKFKIICGDGRAGYPEHAPYQVIHVGAAAPVIPNALVEQLASPGRMFIPVGVEHQDIWQVDKDANGNVTRKKLFGVTYVPLTDKEKQWAD